jgi:hypothetical protein
MAASDYVPIFFKNRLHLAGRPQMSARPGLLQPWKKALTFFNDKGQFETRRLSI